VTLSAKLVEGGTWRQSIPFREASADARRMRLALGLRLAQLPAPAQALRLSVEGFGPPSGEQRDLLGQAAEQRRRRLAEAVGQARAAAGPDAALKVVLVDPESRAPERRCVLAPFQG
jgi:protein ImuB